MLEQNESDVLLASIDGFVTIKIFARTELKKPKQYNLFSFVTIKIFARTEQGA